VLQHLSRKLFALLLGATFIASAQKPALGPFDSHSDVGETPRQGSAEYNPATGEYRITGGGANMWESTDAFHFVWKRLSGDVTLTADVHFLGTGAVEHRKAALIIRQSLEPGAAYADVARHGDGLTSLQYRLTAGATTQEIRSPVSGPVRIRLERHGDQFTMYVGHPGEDLQSSGPVTVVLHDPVYAGLAVCSHDANILETAVFSNVKIDTPSR
jgi:TolB protein